MSVNELYRNKRAVSTCNITKGKELIYFQNKNVSQRNHSRKDERVTNDLTYCVHRL